MKIENKFNSRKIRVFVSSTFEDFEEERNLLMTHVWPALRKICRERRVEFNEVDLRWGITRKQSQNNEILKLCLHQIDDCHPFFIGLIGERYGFIPGEEFFTSDLTEKELWLLDKNIIGETSISEIEMMHGLLNKPNKEQKAFFYFRDSNYALTKPKTIQSLFTQEDQTSVDKLNRLKNKIRSLKQDYGITLHENLPDPKSIALQIKNDFTALIEKTYPLNKQSNINDELNSKHQAYAISHCRFHIKRKDNFERLNKYVQEDSPAFIIEGPSGYGKTSLLANWILEWQNSYPDDFVFQHYIGCTPNSTEYISIVRRLTNEIKTWCNDTAEISTDNNALILDFPNWLKKAAAKAHTENIHVIIIIDALNQLTDDNDLYSILNLPQILFHPPLRLILSTNSIESLGNFKEKGWIIYKIDHLDIDERKEFIKEYLAKHGKSLDSNQSNSIVKHPESVNPLFLKTLLNDLCISGKFRNLNQNLQYYLTSTDIYDLFKKILNQLEKYYEDDCPGLVEQSLSLIYAARYGLSESELLEIIKPGESESSKLPALIWIPLRIALDESLIDSNGILNFSHEYFRKAVEMHYLNDAKVRDTMLKLVKYFESKSVDIRVIEELPWLYMKLEKWNNLFQTIMNPYYFVMLQDYASSELDNYWNIINNLGSNSPLRNLSMFDWMIYYPNSANDLVLNSKMPAIKDEQINEFKLRAGRFLFRHGAAYAAVRISFMRNKDLLLQRLRNGDYDAHEYLFDFHDALIQINEVGEAVQLHSEVAIILEDLIKNSETDIILESKLTNEPYKIKRRNDLYIEYNCRLVESLIARVKLEVIAETRAWMLARDMFNNYEQHFNPNNKSLLRIKLAYAESIVYCGDDKTAEEIVQEVINILDDYRAYRLPIYFRALIMLFDIQFRNSPNKISFDRWKNIYEQSKQFFGVKHPISLEVGLKYSLISNYYYRDKKNKADIKKLLTKIYSFTNYEFTYRDRLTQLAFKTIMEIFNENPESFLITDFPPSYIKF